jgi:hypothetical protein
LAEARAEGILLESGARLALVWEGCFNGYLVKEAAIPRNIEMLGQGASHGHAGTPEFESRLRTIDESCLAGCLAVGVKAPPECWRPLGKKG